MTAKPPRHRMGPPLEFLQRLWALNHALESMSNHMVTRLGVTAQQRLVIRCLGKYPGLLAGQLASLLHLDPGTVSAALRRLEKRRLITRTRDPNDKRRVALHLTSRGRALDRGTPGTAENAVKKVIARSNPIDIAATRRVLDHLTQLLQQEMTQRPSNSIVE